MKQNLEFLFRRFRRDESGVVMILAASLLFVFVGFAALTVDVGYLYSAKQKLQATANSAALAAAAHIAESCSTASSCPAFQDATNAASNFIAANWNNSLSSGNPPVLTITGKCLAALVTAGASCFSAPTAQLPQYNSLSLRLSVTAPTFF